MFDNGQYVICPKTQAFFPRINASNQSTTIVKEDSEVHIINQSVDEIIEASLFYYGKKILHKEWTTRKMSSFTLTPELRLICYPQNSCQTASHVWLLYSKVQLIEESDSALKNIYFKDGSNIKIPIDLNDSLSIYYKNSTFRRIYLYDQLNGIQFVKEERTIQYTTYFTKSR